MSCKDVAAGRSFARRGSRGARLGTRRAVPGWWQCSPLIELLGREVTEPGDRRVEGAVQAGGRDVGAAASPPAGAGGVDESIHRVPRGDTRRPD